MAKSSLLPLLTAFLLAGCAAGEARWVWVHPRHGDERRQMDLEQCRKVAAQELANPFAFPGLGQDYFEEKQDLLRRCMEERGWRQQEPGTSSGRKN